MWFTKAQIHTEALDKLVKGTKANLEKELISIIEEMLGEFELEEIKLSLNDLQNAVKDSYYKVSISKINEIVKEKWKLPNPNSSYYQYYKSLNPGTNEWQVSCTNKKGRCYSFKKEFIQGMLNC